VRVRVLGGPRLRVRLRLVVPRWGWRRYRPAVELHLTPGGSPPRPREATADRQAFNPLPRAGGGRRGARSRGR